MAGDGNGRAVRVAAVVVVLALALGAAFSIPLPLLAVAPGPAISLGERLTIDGTSGDVIEGDYLFLAIAVSQVTLAGAVAGGIDPDVDVIPRSRLIPDGVDLEAFGAEQEEIFAAATDLAIALGLEAAGADIDLDAIGGGGLAVGSVDPGGPAAGVLEQGDVILSADGVELRVLDDLVGVVRQVGPQDELELQVERGEELRDVRLDPVTAEESGLDGVQLGFTFDVVPLEVDLPVDVDFDSGGVGGPSAGLLTALAAYDLLAEEDLAAGRRIAGTGEISPDGAVLPIGSVGDKLDSAVAADADVFLVPADQASQARAALADAERPVIVGVRTLDEAISALREG